jgi:5-methylthioadenosine/S-adenosylhomocysteine deaminase
LLTVDEEALIHESQEYAQKIDVFLTQREQSVLSKLIAIGGATQEESFEVQAKVAVDDLTPILEALQRPEIEIIRERHFREYDTYFAFDDPKQGRIRYREDHFIGPNGEITNVRSRLTHIGPAREYYFPEGALLSRSRFLAPAMQSLRFYKEYFQPRREIEIDKERLRYLVRFHDTEFFINLDTVSTPKLGMYVEVKSRTWSRKDADQKSRLVAELLQFLGASPQGIQSQDYIEMLERVSVDGKAID